MMIFKKTAIYLAIIGIVFALYVIFVEQKTPPQPSFPIPPEKNPFNERQIFSETNESNTSNNSIAPSTTETASSKKTNATLNIQETIVAAGIVEAFHENITIGVPVAALVLHVYVKVWDHVRAGDPLFQLDDRELKAQLIAQKANVDVAKAGVVRLEDQLNRLLSVKDPRAVSVDDVRTRTNDVSVAKAQLNYAKAQVQQTERLIARLTVRSPKAGVILQSNIRDGEYASPNTNEAPMVLGELNIYQIRVDIDEQNASKFKPESTAIAYPKNNTTFAIPLKFLRVEPYIIPKMSLTGASGERVDTRVLQVIYTFEQPKNFNMYVGQQVDVYIRTNAALKEENEADLNPSL